MKVIAPKIIDCENVLSCLSAAFDVAERIKAEDKAVLDLSEIDRATPAFVLPLLLLVKDFGELEIKVPKTLEEISFPNGVDSSSLRLSSFKAIMQGFEDKGFIPIVKFPAKKYSEDVTNNILSVVENVLSAQIGDVRNIVTGLRYIIGECVDNITQHARSDFGFIHAALNAEKKYMDVCIADKGITLLGSYKENHDTDISSDIEALQAANRGISTKNLPDAENRGFGIITSKKMLTDGLGGLFIMLSGGAMVVKSERSNDYFELPEGVRFDGTMWIYRMPYDSKDFNYINFVE